MRKSVIGAAVWMLVMAAGSPAWGQVWGQFGGAGTIPSGSRQGGAYLLFSENTTGLLGQLRLSFYPNIDFGFAGGFTRLDYAGGDNTTVRLGTDLKVRVTQSLGRRLMATMAIGGILGVETGDDYSLLTVGPTLVLSRAFKSGMKTVEPYARVGIAITTYETDLEDETDVSLPLRFGVTSRLTPSLELVGELQVNVEDSVNDDLGFALGVNLPF